MSATACASDGDASGQQGPQQGPVPALVDMNLPDACSSVLGMELRSRAIQENLSVHGIEGHEDAIIAMLMVARNHHKHNVYLSQLACSAVMPVGQAYLTQPTASLIRSG